MCYPQRFGSRSDDLISTSPSGPGTDAVPFSIGFSGHRWNRIAPSDAPRLHLALTALYDRLDRALVAVSPTMPVELCSGLAEGADQVAAQAMPAHWQLTAMLALPRHAFRCHLETHGTREGEQDLAAHLELLRQAGDRVVELPDRAADEAEAAPFVRLRDALIARAQLILAVWDQRAGAASPGGTADVLLGALRSGKPAIVLPTGGACAWVPYRFDGLATDGTPCRGRLDPAGLVQQALAGTMRG